MITQNMTDKKMTNRKIYTILSFEEKNSILNLENFQK